MKLTQSFCSLCAFLFLIILPSIVLGSVSCIDFLSVNGQEFALESKKNMTMKRYEEGRPRMTGQKKENVLILLLKWVLPTKPFTSLRKKIGTDAILKMVMRAHNSGALLLDLSNLDLKDKELIFLVKHNKSFFQSVKRIDLNNNPGLTIKSLSFLLENTDSLKEINLHVHPRLQPKSPSYSNYRLLKLMLELHPDLSRIYMDRLSPYNLGQLLKFKRLLVLDLTGTNLLESRLGEGFLMGHGSPSIRDVEVFFKKSKAQNNGKDKIRKIDGRPSSSDRMAKMFLRLGRGVQYQNHSTYYINNPHKDMALDGDTFYMGPYVTKMIGGYSSKIIELTQRLYAVNTAEIGAKAANNIEKKVAEAGEYFVKTMLEASTEALITEKTKGKFSGREVVDVHLKIKGTWVLLNSMIYTHGLGSRYFGDSRSDLDWEEFYIKNKASVDFWSAQPDIRSLERLGFFN